MRIKKNSIVIFVTIGAIFGYPLVAGLSATFGLPNSLMSLALRASVAIMSLYLILDNIGVNKKGIDRLILYCISGFILFYIFRLTINTMLARTMPVSEAINYWIWAIGSAFLPVLGLSMAKSHDINWTYFYNKALILTFIASIFVAMNISTTVTNEIETYNSGRARLETLNPISLGHLGASLFLLSLSLIWKQSEKWRIQSLLLIAGTLLGLSLIVAANSRGPIVGTATALLFAWLVLPGQRKGLTSLIFIVVAVSFVPVLIWFENNFGVTTYSRLFGQSLSSEVNVVARLDLYILALQAFADHPLLGAGLNVADVGSYPHNVTIEAFLSVGIFGGLLFTVVQILTVVLTWKICRERNELIWIGMIVIQYMVAAQFSGSLYASPHFWAVIGLSTFAFSANVAREYQPFRKN